MHLLLRLNVKLRQFFSGKNGLWRAMGFGLAGLLVAAIPAVTQAGSCGLDNPDMCVAMIFVWIFSILTGLMGFIIVMEVDALVRVAQFYNFVSPGPTAVRLGWVVTRDLANMFFIVFLLIIAFSTIVGYAKYHYEKNLFRLLVMAIVINFSKTICGLFIDASQVLMLSFVNGFKAAAGGNFLNAFQIDKLLQLAKGQSDYSFGLVLAMMLAFILAAIAACVLLVMLVMMVFRNIMLWVLIILSPIAFLTSAFPMSSNYYAQWWGEFKKYLVGGPVIAFFLWLALATAQTTGGQLSSQEEGWGKQSTASSQEVAGQTGELGLDSASIPSEAGRTDTILSVVIMTCIMFAGLKFASDPSIGGLASGFAGKVKGKVENTIRGAAFGTAGYALGRGKEATYRYGGGVLAKVPLVGALGRNLALKGESMQKKRLAEREKMFGTPEDVARLSPGRFMSNLNNLHRRDPKEYEKWLKAGLANPATAALMERSGDGAAALNLMIRNAKGKDFLGAADLMTSDKRVAGWAKAVDANGVLLNPELLQNSHKKLKEMAEAAGADPALKKKLEAFEQKFMPQLAQIDQLDANGNATGRKILSADDVKKLAPKMSLDDVGDMDEKGLEMAAKHMTTAQLSRIMETGKDDQKRGVLASLKQNPAGVAKALADKGIRADAIPASWFADAEVAGFALDRSRGDAKAIGEMSNNTDKLSGLQTAATQRLDAAIAAGDAEKTALATIDAINVGAINAAGIDAKAGLSDLLKNSNLNVGLLARGIDETDKNKTDAARKAIEHFVSGQSVDRVRNLDRQEQYRAIMPSKDFMQNQISSKQQAVQQTAEAARTAARQTAEQQRTIDREALLREAPDTVQNIQGQIDTLEAEIRAGRGGSTAQAASNQLTRVLTELERKITERDDAKTDVGNIEQRLAQAQAAGAPAEEIRRLESTLTSLKKAVETLDTDLATRLARFKGETPPTPGGRGGGGRTI